MKTKNVKLYKGLSVIILGILLVSGCTKKNNVETVETNQHSEEKQTHEHKHKHAHDGEFKEEEVQNRTLQDWSGDWQSVYPYLLDGTLDEVLEHKAEEKKDKSFDEYKTYYTVGYKTDTQRIVIKGNTVEFFKGDTSQKADYQYDGYQILTYDSGKKGVRYLFSVIDDNNAAPKHIQFSDHNIKPTKAEHFHLYFGDESQETLLKELENWPTYYKSDLSGSDIVHDMLYNH
ncbi:zinc transport system substrate-binding protein [Enterococcus sp. DIV0840]|uniref:metal-binding protein ZinT n=1 Tax=unclassified Enterococcus TaxID=2608891 RepID=UPI001A8D19E6|nr:metal-binding protein ZinT [Enterococcus sp. DIV0849a]MBO0435686.1 metal-binding protein ZinT [Enterococcus sp. DIV0849a]